MIFGILIEETADAYVVEVVGDYGDAKEFGISGRQSFPKSESSIDVHSRGPFTGLKRVYLTTTREVLEQLARTCFAD